MLYFTFAKKSTSAAILLSWSPIFLEQDLCLIGSILKNFKCVVRMAKGLENISLASLLLELRTIYFNAFNIVMQTCDLYAKGRHFSNVDKHLCVVLAQGHTRSK